MKQCPFVQDLLPLYVDDEVSPESRQLIEVHLSECPDCRGSLAALRGAPSLPTAASSPTPPDEARFLSRLKRQAGTAAGLILTLLIVTALGSVQYGKWSRDKERSEQFQAEYQQERLAVERLKTLSPDPAHLLEQNGVTWTGSATRTASEIRLDWVITLDPAGGVESVMPARHRGGTEVLIIDPQTGEPLERRGGSGSASYHQGKAEGTQQVHYAGTGPVRVALEFPALLLYKPIQEPIRWEFERPEGDGEVALNQRVTAHGVEFLLELVRFTGNRVTIKYRQLTDPSKVGYHFLPLQLSDRLGSNWGGLPMEQIPDPLSPSAEYSYISTPSRNFRLTLGHVALAIPARFEADVK